ncbi:hypothetical protein ACFCYN_04725 [Gottfriedia sp. NPDC056225]|uniref:hypothetical protein n=1 Tax=Gottfriedia sp. NPDC056225 TaxID=3345751 RepID=UPI00155913DB|nr:hypothetical protein HPK19_20540 [Arthrobacter citreus]
MKGLFNKKWLLISFIGLVLLASIIWYAVVPIRFEQVLPTNKTIEEIDFMEYIDGMNMSSYNNKFKQKNEIKSIIDVLKKTNYRRVIWHKKTDLTDKYLDFALLYKKEYHIFGLSEKGYLTVDEKTYKVTKQPQELFHELLKIMAIKKE